MLEIKSRHLTWVGPICDYATDAVLFHLMYCVVATLSINDEVL